MKLQKSQLRLIILLNCALVLIVCAIFIELFAVKENSVSVTAPPSNDSQTIKPDYSLSRKARISLSSAISLENNLGGTSNDTVVDAFAVNEKIYLFGNTTSSDLDMADSLSRSFMAVINENLSIENLYFLGESNSKLEKVILAENGFLTAFSISGRVTLSLYTYDGTLKRTTLSDSSGSSEACDLQLIENGYMLITSPHNAPIGKNRLLIQIYDNSLFLTYERLITTAYQVEYLNAYALNGEYLLFYRAFSDLGSHLGVARCTSATTVTTQYIDTDSDYKPLKVLPYSSGFVANCIFSDGKGSIMLLDDNFHSKTIYKSQNNCDNGFIFFTNGLFYSGFSSENSLLCTTYDFSFEKSNEIDLFPTLPSSIHSGNAYGLFACSSKNDLFVIGTNGSCSLCVEVKNAQNAKIIRSGNNFFIICSTDLETKDVGEVFGDNDVWIGKLCI